MTKKTGITVANNTVALNILLPDKPSTNFIERASELGSAVKWRVLGAFSDDTPGEITWFEAAQPAGAGFYRVRTE